MARSATGKIVRVYVSGVPGSVDRSIATDMETELKKPANDHAPTAAKHDADDTDGMTPADAHAFTPAKQPRSSLLARFFVHCSTLQLSLRAFKGSASCVVKINATYKRMLTALERESSVSTSIDSITHDTWRLLKSGDDQPLPQAAEILRIQ
ncbi:hypothetical protein FI667_g10997, partial [Globisporangium splendens]